MKKIRIPRLKKHRSFAEKFGRDTAFFGSREKHEPTDVGSVPFLLLCMLGVALLTLGIMFLGKLWKVESVHAEDGRYYTAVDVLNAAGIQTGDEMLGFDGFVVAKELKEEFPLMDRVKIRKKLNGHVAITFTEVGELYYTCHNVNYYIIDAETREVLCIMATPDEARRVGAIYLGLPECTRVRVGETLSFVNLPYIPETDVPELSTYELETDVPEKENAYVFEFVEILMASELADRVVGMELGDRYDLQVVLEGGILIRLGDMDELERKLTVTKRCLDDKAQEGFNAGTLPVLVDVTNPTHIIHRASPEIDLPPWA